MPTCPLCGKDFDLSTAKRSMGAKYGAGTYDDYAKFYSSPVCSDCLSIPVENDIATGKEIEELMYGHDWDPD